MGQRPCRETRWLRATCPPTSGNLQHARQRLGTAILYSPFSPVLRRTMSDREKVYRQWHAPRRWGPRARPARGLVEGSPDSFANESVMGPVALSRPRPRVR